MSHKEKAAVLLPSVLSLSEGMGRALIREFQYSKTVFEELSDLSGRDVLGLATTAGLAEVQDYYNRFLVHSAISIAEWEVVKKETGIVPYCFGGLSLGEMISVQLAEKISVEELVSVIFVSEDVLSSGVSEKYAFIWIKGLPLNRLKDMFGDCLGEESEAFLSMIISNYVFTISSSKKGAEEKINILKN